MGTCISQLKSLKEHFVASGEEAADENVEWNLLETSPISKKDNCSIGKSDWINII